MADTLFWIAAAACVIELAAFFAAPRVAAALAWIPVTTTVVRRSARHQLPATRVVRDRMGRLHLRAGRSSAPVTTRTARFPLSGVRLVLRVDLRQARDGVKLRVFFTPYPLLVWLLLLPSVALRVGTAGALALSAFILLLFAVGFLAARQIAAWALSVVSRELQDGTPATAG